MPWDSDEFKAKVVEEMRPPSARRMAEGHWETWISEPHLAAWRR